MRREGEYGCRAGRAGLITRLSTAALMCPVRATLCCHAAASHAVPTPGETATLQIFGSVVQDSRSGRTSARIPTCSHWERAKLRPAAQNWAGSGAAGRLRRTRPTVRRNPARPAEGAGRGPHKRGVHRACEAFSTAAQLHCQQLGKPRAA
jgi:hypothetical protein